MGLSGSPPGIRFPEFMSQSASWRSWEGYFTGLWTGKVLRQGDVGIEVQQLQYFLSIISESYPSIPSVTVDSRFGPGLDRSVRAFQREFGLAVDGLVGRYTWNSIYETYAAIVG